MRNLYCYEGPRHLEWSHAIKAVYTVVSDLGSEVRKEHVILLIAPQHNQRVGMPCADVKMMDRNVYFPIMVLVVQSWLGDTESTGN